MKKIVPLKTISFLFIFTLQLNIPVLSQKKDANMYLFYDKTDSLILKKTEGKNIYYFFYDEKLIEQKKKLKKNSIFLPEGFQEYTLFIQKSNSKPVLCKEKIHISHREDIEYLNLRRYSNIYIIEKDKCGYYRKVLVFFEPNL